MQSSPKISRMRSKRDSEGKHDGNLNGNDPSIIQMPIRQLHHAAHRHKHQGILATITQNSIGKLCRPLLQQVRKQRHRKSH